MKKVLHASDLFEEKKEEKALKPIEFIDIITEKGSWSKELDLPNRYDKVIYLGKDRRYGDLFIAYYSESIHLFKGHLNDGIIE